MGYKYCYNSFGWDCSDSSRHGLLYTKEIVFLLTFIIYGVLILVMRIERVDVSDHPGWTEVEKGVFQGPKMLDSTTPDFAEFAEQSRARWDVLEWLKVKIKQLSGRRTPTPKT